MEVEEREPRHIPKPFPEIPTPQPPPVRAPRPITQRELFQPDKVTHKVVGLKDAQLVYHCADSVWTRTDDLTITIFDTTSRANAIRILLTNSTGATRYLTGCAIRGKLVKKISGDEGYINDSYVDYESIEKNGERLLKIANDFIVIPEQTDKLADLHWKDNRPKKHQYVVVISGCCLWFEQGEWYGLKIGNPGEKEYIDSKVRCESVDIEQGTSDLGKTVITFREVEENWKAFSRGLVQFIISGSLKRPGNNQNVINIGAKDFIGNANTYCIGTDDQEAVNDAANWLAATHEGGLIRLLGSKFYLSNSIIYQNNITIEGDGWGTVIEKDCNASAIKAVGSSGSEVTNVELRNIKVIRKSTDTNAVPLIYFEYVKNLKINRVYAYYAYNNWEIWIQDCFDDVIIWGCLVEGHAAGTFYCGAGVRIRRSTGGYGHVKFLANKIHDTAYGLSSEWGYDGIYQGNIFYKNKRKGLYVGAKYSSIVNNQAVENGSGNTLDFGIAVGDHDIEINSNYARGNDPDGIKIYSGVTGTLVVGNRAKDNVVNDYLDNGTGTQAYGNRWG